MVPFMIDNLGQKMVTSVIYFMYTLGKKKITSQHKNWAEM